jgi:hypothetical protein
VVGKEVVVEVERCRLLYDSLNVSNMACAAKQLLTVPSSGFLPGIHGVGSFHPTGHTVTLSCDMCAESPPTHPPLTCRASLSSSPGATWSSHWRPS